MMKKIRLSQTRAALVSKLQSLTGDDTNANSLQFDESITGDACDMASGIVDREMASRLAERESQEISQIMQAISKIDNGSYGICENCNNAIGQNRLDALPYCVLCVNCRRLAECGEI